MQNLSIFRTLPPAGPPLPFSSLMKSLGSLFSDKEIEKLAKEEIKKYFNVENVLFTDSGRSALSLALMSLHNLFSVDEKEKRNEVLIPAYVSYSVPSAVVHAGFKVRLYDVEPDTLTPDYESMQANASEKTVAIVLCHQFGLPFESTKAKEIASKIGAYVVDDAAQVMGGMAENCHAGTMGDVGLFSLSRGKPLTSVEGGVLLCNSLKIASSIETTVTKLYAKSENQHSQSIVSALPTIIKAFALYLLRKPFFYTIPASLPFLNIGASIFEPDFPDGPMSKYRIGLLRASLPLLENTNILRRKWAEKYSNLVNSSEELRVILKMPETKAIYLRYPLLPKEGYEKCIKAILQAENGKRAKKLGISRGFPLPLYAVEELKPHLAEIQANPDELYKGAKYLAENLITLPTHDQVKENDFEAIKSFLYNSSKENGA